MPAMSKVLPTHVGVIPPLKLLIFNLSSTTHTRGGDPSISLKKIKKYEVLPTHVGVIPSNGGDVMTIESTTHTRGGDPTSKGCWEY